MRGNAHVLPELRRLILLAMGLVCKGEVPLQKDTDLCMNMGKGIAEGLYADMEVFYQGPFHPRAEPPLEAILPIMQGAACAHEPICERI